MPCRSISFWKRALLSQSELGSISLFQTGSWNHGRNQRMPKLLPRVHCELGPVLINRTAVYKMCKAVPGELARRGLRVSCSALLARLAPDKTEPPNPWEHRLFRFSERWLHWAITRPGLFSRTHFATGIVPRWQHGS